MKKLTKVKNVYANKKVRLAAGLLAGVAVLTWAWCITTRPAVGVIDFGAAQAKAKLYQSVITEQRKYEEQIQVRIAADSVDLEKEAKELESKKASMKPEEYQKKAMNIQQRFMVIQNKYRPAVERIVAASQIALKSAEKEIAKAVEQPAQQGKEEQDEHHSRHPECQRPQCLGSQGGGTGLFAGRPRIAVDVYVQSQAQ